MVDMITLIRFATLGADQHALRGLDINLPGAFVSSRPAEGQVRIPVLFVAILGTKEFSPSFHLAAVFFGRKPVNVSAVRARAFRLVHTVSIGQFLEIVNSFFLI